jgi:hypothetical protein
LKFNDYFRSYIVVFHYLVFGILTWLGGCVVEWPFRRLGGVIRMLYFVLFFV